MTALEVFAHAFQENPQASAFVKDDVLEDAGVDPEALAEASGRELIKHREYYLNEARDQALYYFRYEFRPQ